jgi:hypothetical protein
VYQRATRTRHAIGAVRLFQMNYPKIPHITYCAFNLIIKTSYYYHDRNNWKAKKTSHYRINLTIIAHLRTNLDNDKKTVYAL